MPPRATPATDVDDPVLPHAVLDRPRSRFLCERQRVGRSGRGCRWPGVVRSGVRERGVVSGREAICGLRSSPGARSRWVLDSVSDYARLPLRTTRFVIRSLPVAATLDAHLRKEQYDSQQTNYVPRRRIGERRRRCVLAHPRVPRTWLTGPPA